MDERTYHGAIKPEELGYSLMQQFNAGQTRAQWYRTPDNHVVVQIASRDGDAAVTVTLRRVEDGVNVAVAAGQPWHAAASLAQAGARALVNPLSLLLDLGAITQDLGELNLPNQVWAAVENYCRSVGAGLGGSPEKTVVVCEYCGTGNPVGSGTCAGCGAPLGARQPKVCPKCGQYNPVNARFCGRCGTAFVG